MYVNIFIYYAYLLKFNYIYWKHLGTSRGRFDAYRGHLGVTRSRFFSKKSDPSEMGHFWWDFVGVKNAPVSVWGVSLSNESPQEPPRG